MKWLIPFLFSSVCFAQSANWPGSSVSISGTVNAFVTNFPASQTVNQSSGSLLHADIDNFPSSQAITGTVTANQGGAWSVGRTWNLLNTTDSVNVGNFPATQAVTQSGTWTTGRTWSLLNSTDSVNAVQSGNWNVRLNDGAGNIIGSQAINGTNYLNVSDLPNFSFSHVVGATTVTVKSGAGILHTICQNATANSETITVYNNTTATAPIIAAITPSQGGRCAVYDIAFSTGLTIVQTAAASDSTVSYK